MAQRLSQILAVEKGIKSRWQSTLTELYKLIQKPAAFTGFAKTYQPIDEDGDELPPEGLPIQHHVVGVLHTLRSRGIEMFDVTATKDVSNTSTNAPVVIDGDVILPPLPPTHLLFLEKQLTDLMTFFSKLPVLDSTERWAHDSIADLYRATPTTTVRTKKVQRPIVMYDATPEHPAQTQMITEDVRVGTWTVDKTSAAITVAERDHYVSRVERLLNAVKQAREEANSATVVEVSVGAHIFNYLGL